MVNLSGAKVDLNSDFELSCYCNFYTSDLRKDSMWYLVSLFIIDYVRCITLINQEADYTDSDSMWWGDDYVYDADAGYYNDQGGVSSTVADAWFQGTDNSDLGGTSTCSQSCLSDGWDTDATVTVHGWWDNTAGS